jgi:ankyrin repeat protein
MTLNEHARKEILDSLRFDKIDVRYATIKRAHSRTCRWLLQKDAYRDWLDPTKLAEHMGFFWIKGKPGAGKSTLMKCIFDTTRKKRGKVIISFFFNARGEPLERSTTGMYRSLLLQLLEKLPKLQAVFGSREYAMWSNDTLQDGIELLKALFEDAVLHLGTSQLVCFIDALDECGEEQIRDMVSFFEQVGEQAVLCGVSFRVCFSSRYYPHITIRKGLSLELEKQEEHSQDISEYLDTELRIGQGKLAQEIRAGLREKAAGVFMWVFMVVGILQKEYDNGRVHTLKRKLQETPADLHDVFRNILTRDQQEKGKLLLCIQWVLLASKPLRPEELYWAIFSGTELEVVSAHDPNNFEKSHIETYILSSSKGLTEMTSSRVPTVQFIHESVRDFLLKEDGLRDIWSGLGNDFRGDSHERLKECCWQYMQVAASRLKIETSFEKSRRREVSKVRRDASKTFPFLGYAVQNVLFHADAANAGGVPQYDFLQTTFQLAQWIMYDNLFEIHQPRRHSLSASLLYILAERNLPSLITAYHGKQSCFQSEDQRHGSPIMAAVVANSQSAIYALLKAEAGSAGAASPIHALYEEFRLLKWTGEALPRQHGKFEGKYPVFLPSAVGEKELLACALLSTNSNTNVDSRDTQGSTPLHYAAISNSESTARLLLDNRAQIEATDFRGRTPLHYAAKHHAEAIIRLLLDYGAQTKAIDFQGRTPLHYAAKHHAEAIIRLLLDHGAQTKANDFQGCTPLHFAVKNSTEAIVRLLLDRGAQTKATSQDGKTPLHYSAEYNAKAVARLLLDHGARTEATDKNGKTPLHYAAKCNAEAVARLLLDHGAQTEATDQDGKTPLHYAVVNHYEVVARLLLDHGAQTEATDQDGKTPLHYASRNATLVSVLLEKGAQIEATDNNGQAVLSLAASFESGRFGKTAESILRILIARGAQIEATDKTGRTALLHAARSNEVASFTLLLILKHGAQIDTVDIHGRTALSHAADRGNVAKLKVLLEYGAKIDVIDNDGRTALLYAARYGKMAGLKLLIDHGAQIETVDVDGRTALSHAASNRYGGSGIVRTLLGKGARANAADKEGRIPASYAAASRNLTALKALLKANPSDINSVDLHGRSLLSFAAESYYDDNVNTVELLLEGGALIDIADDKGRKPLFYAISDFKKYTRAEVDRDYSSLWTVQHLKRLARVMRLLTPKGALVKTLSDEQWESLPEANLDGTKLVDIMKEFADDFLSQHPSYRKKGPGGERRKKDEKTLIT